MIINRKFKISYNNQFSAVFLSKFLNFQIRIISVWKMPRNRRNQRLRSSVSRSRTRRTRSTSSRSRTRSRSRRRLSNRRSASRPRRRVLRSRTRTIAQRQNVIQSSQSPQNPEAQQIVNAVQTDDVDKTVENSWCCPICLESSRYKNPTSTFCGHIFCGSCLAKIPVQDGFISCPMCRKRTKVANFRPLFI